MKNNFLFFAVTLSLIIWIFSCKKSEISIDQIDSQTPKIENRDPFTSIGGDVWNLIQDTTDVESNKINWALMHFAKATNQAVTTPAYNQLIIDQMWASPIPFGGKSIVDLCSSNLAFKNYFETQLRSSLLAYVNSNPPVYVSMQDLQNPNWSPLIFLTSILVHNGVNYLPYLHFQKLTSGMTKNYNLPIIAIGQQVAGTDDEDNIPGWQGNTQILISEDGANSYAGIIIIIGNSLVPAYNQNTTFVPLQGLSQGIVQNQVNDRAPNDINMTQWQIKRGYRFEKGGKSELAGGFYKYHYVNGYIQFDEGWDMGWNSIKISKNDIYDSKSFTGYRYSFRGSSTLSDGFMMITYEKDWYAHSYWTLPCDSSVLFDMSCSEPHEYYFRDCTGYPKTTWFTNNDEFIINNDKSSFKFKWSGE